MSKVTKRIDETLKERGIAKSQFYFDCGITSSAYSQWNTEKTEPKISSLRRIADYLNVNYEWLSLGVGKKEKAPAEAGERKDVLDEVDVAFYGDYRELTEDDKETVRDMVRIMRERRTKQEK